MYWNNPDETKTDQSSMNSWTWFFNWTYKNGSPVSKCFDLFDEKFNALLMKKMLSEN